MVDSLTPVPAIGPPRPSTPALPESMLHGTSSSEAGVLGESNFGPGISGRSVAFGGGSPPGPVELIRGGRSDGVLGESQGTGVHGVSNGNGDGVLGESGSGNGVHGKSAGGSSGVWGENAAGGYGVSGSTVSNFQPGGSGTAGVWGNNAGSGIGVKGTSASGDAVVGFSTSTTHAGVSAVNDSGGFGVWARGTPSGHFEGNVEVSGDLNLGGKLNISSTGDVILSDCAEFFELADSRIESGTVMVIGSDGRLCPCKGEYDRKVAGVVSGGGNLRAGIVLGNHPARTAVLPIALAGRTFCMVDANKSPIEVGDLLTTSSTPGHAMKALDMPSACGALIGKALRPLASGRSLIPILVALQ